MKCDTCNGEGWYRESWYENKHRCYDCNATGVLNHVQVGTKLTGLKRQREALKSELAQLDQQIAEVETNLQTSSQSRVPEPFASSPMSELPKDGSGFTPEEMELLRALIREYNGKP